MDSEKCVLCKCSILDNLRCWRCGHVQDTQLSPYFVLEEFSEIYELHRGIKYLDLLYAFRKINFTENQTLLGNKIIAGNLSAKNLIELGVFR